MALIDAEGRLWGRWNLFDAVLVVFAAALIPLTYGAYALFRTPLPSLVAVEPISVESGAPNLRVRIRGVNLKPYLRVSFDTYQGRTFLFMDSTRAEVELNNMEPGVYDVVLYDNTQERSRLPKALTVTPPATPPPTTWGIVVGRFTSLTPAQASQIRPQMAIPGSVEVLEVGKAVPALPKVFAGGPLLELPVANLLQVPVLLRLGCDVRAPNGYPECYALKFTLRPAFMGAMPTPIGDLAFQVDQVAGTQPFEFVRATVRFNGPSEALSELRQGDVDAAIADNELAAGATIVALSPMAGANASQRDATLRIRAQRTPAGWMYVTAPLRLGGGFAFRSPRHEVGAVVLSVAAEQSAPPAGRR